MNRPSRSDDTTEHPTWNQSPPSLAADLTTCEDLNGMANAREHRGGRGNGTGAESRLGAMEDPPVREASPPPQDGRAGTWSQGQRSCGSCPLIKESVACGFGSLPIPLQQQSPVGRRSKAAVSWGTWLLSVLAMSILLNHFQLPASFGYLNGVSVLLKHDPDAELTASSTNSTISSPLVTSSLAKRSTCGSGTTFSRDEYNLGLHVMALFLVLVVSYCACALSIFAKKFPKLNIPAGFFFAIRHFGTGVLLATAFVHLLPTAFTYLGDPCLSSFWTDKYPAIPGAIALGGVFFVALIEMYLSPHNHINELAEKPAVSQTARDESAVVDSEIDAKPAPVYNNKTVQRRASSGGNMGDMGPLRGRSLSISRQLSRAGRPDDAAFGRQKEGHDVEVASGTRQPLSPEAQHKKDILQCMLLEMGILFHSVFIGMALSVSIGKDFIVLLVAIVFHQSFEGLALGARIAAINWPEKTWQPWLMALAYGCTTPVGQAIGLSVHSLYDPNGELGLILVGTMNAISSGLLVFASLVELLGEDFLSDESFKVLHGKKRIAACLLVFFGALGMSVVGAWA